MGFPGIALGFPEAGESAVNSGIHQNALTQRLLPLGDSILFYFFHLGPVAGPSFLRPILFLVITRGKGLPVSPLGSLGALQCKVWAWSPAVLYSAHRLS